VFPNRHGKMVAASHSLVNTVMIEQPEHLLHMDIIGPSRVRSMGGKWYVLVIVDDYSHYRVFNLETNTIIGSCDVTFDETAPCPRDVFDCVSDKEKEESIFADEEL
jgi:hypothetical protein